MRKICTLLLVSFLFNSNVFSQNCDNWLKITNKLDGITIGDLDITGNKLTVEANFNATGDLTRSIVSKHYYDIDVNYFLLPDLAQITTTNGFFSAVAPCNYVNNKTYHVAMVYDGASLKFYRNGFLMDSVPASGNLITNNWPTTIGEFAHALYTNNLTNALPMKGYINEVRIWNSVRTQQQLQSYMSSSLPTPTTQLGLQAYYTFDNLINKQGNALYNGALHNGAVISQTNSDCNFIADSCGISTTLNCDNWLKITNKLDGITIGDLDITGNKLTVEANFNATGDLTRSIVSKHYYDIDVNYFLLPDLAQITTTNGFFSAVAPCNYVNNKIYHVAMVYDGASLKFYRNGFLMDSVPASGNLITNNWPTTIGEFAHALYTNNLTNALPMKGYINEVRIWNSVRTQQQLQSYMNGSLPSPTTQAGLQAYYTFDNLINKQGNALYNGVLHNGAVINQTNSDCNFIADSCFVVLPVSITSFDAALQTNRVKLSWQTEQEINIQSYSIERAEGGSGNFVSIGTISAKQNSTSNNYIFIDDRIKAGILYSYRIATNEKSGSKKYSVVKTAIINSREVSLFIFPNPANGVVNYQVNNFKGLANLSFVDGVGRSLFSKTINVVANQNFQLDLRNYPRGTYWLLIKTGEQNIVKKIIRL